MNRYVDVGTSIATTLARVASGVTVGPLGERPEQLLEIYEFESCPFCRRIRPTIDRLGIDIELRDILLDDSYRDELIAERGRATVPVLRITSPDGSERWMPESADIIAYLEELYRRPE